MTGRASAIPRLATLAVLSFALVVPACGGDPEPAPPAVDVPDTTSSPDTQAPADAGPDVSPDPVDSTAEELPETCAAGASCDDGDPCTVQDVCDASGECQGTALDCDDGLDCTDDGCVEGKCEHEAHPLFCVSDGLCVGDGGGCDDGDACTAGDTCLGGQCIASAEVTCDPSENVCLPVVCNPLLGCTEEPSLAPCDDDDFCTTGDACAGGECIPGATALECDDEDPCTIDSCHPDVGCTTAPDPTVCDDGDPCTTDECATGGVCSSAPFKGPCEDGDLCTTGETCAGGECSGGGPVDCEDNNPCTVLAGECEPDAGCQYYYEDAECTDGFSCTNNDICVAGNCVGGKTGACVPCILPTTQQALKVIDLKLSPDGNKGSALDVDNDPTTCSPPGSCSDGVDNAMAAIAPLLNVGLTGSMTEGVTMYVVDLDGYQPPSTAPFPFAVYDCNLTEESEAQGCDFQAESCSYQATQFSFDPTCVPYFGLPNATVVAGKFAAGGPDHVMTIALALTFDTFIPITLIHARVKGDVTYAADGVTIEKITGIIAGATPKSQMIATVESLSSSQLPVDKEIVLNLLKNVVQNDIDLDGDGIDDAASLGIRFKTIPALLED